MGLFDKWFNDDEESTTTTESSGITDNSWCSLYTKLWQKEYALSVVSHILATMLINVVWETYKTGEKVHKEEWFRLNYSPNRKDTSSEFFTKLASQLINNRSAVIIETSKREFFVADEFSFANGQELAMKDNTFIVTIGDEQLNRTFKENRDCMFIKFPTNPQIDAIFDSMAADYQTLKELISEGAERALGMKLELNLSAQGKNAYDKKKLKEIQDAYLPLMKSANSIFVTYKGETLNDLTEKQRGSEVQQVLEAVNNNITINKEILTSVGNAFGIPQQVMTGAYTQDNEDIFGMCVTMFGKPIINLLSKKFSLYLLEKDDILNGSKIEADLESIKFVESLKLATAVDKLIGSGAYSINEVRSKFGDDPVENGDTRFITKNYAVLDKYVKEVNTD